MANPDWVQTVLGTLMVVLAAFWLWIEFQILVMKVRRFLGRTISPRKNPDDSQNVANALAAMYENEGAKYRKSEHGIIEGRNKHGHS